METVSDATSGETRARTRLRPIVIVLIVLQILIPAVMLGLRIADPSRGQLPFGWQMHTLCWGAEDRPACER
jgi:hypothetical protein